MVEDHKIGDLVYNEALCLLGYISAVLTKGQKDHFGILYKYDDKAYEVTWINAVNARDPTAVYYEKSLDLIRKAYMDNFE